MTVAENRFTELKERLRDNQSERGGKILRD